MPNLRILLREYRSLFLFVLLLMVFRTGYADWSPVPTSSMEPTIFPGDVVWIDKTSYGPSLPFINRRLLTWGRPARGDIVTLIPPHEDVLYVKRVIGIAGDVLHIEGNVITLNGVALEQRLLERAENELLGAETIDGREHFFKIGSEQGMPYFGQRLTVPEGKLFVMGDYRNKSADSRYFGFVDESKVMGRVSTIALSLAAERSGSARIAIPVQ